MTLSDRDLSQMDTDYLDDLPEGRLHSFFGESLKSLSALYDGDALFFLKMLDRSGQGGMGNMADFSRTAEMPGFGESEKIMNLTNKHVGVWPLRLLRLLPKAG